MADPGHPEHRELKAWYGEPFDADDAGEAAAAERVAELAREWAA